MLKISLTIDDDGVIDQKYLIKERNKNYPFFSPPFLRLLWIPRRYPLDLLTISG